MNPRRGDEVEAWIKRFRDSYSDHGWEDEWAALDDLLDDYRLHADTGTSLSQDVSETQQNLVEGSMDPIAA